MAAIVDRSTNVRGVWLADAATGDPVSGAPLPTGAATAANQTAEQANPGSDAAKAVAVQGVTGGKPVVVIGNVADNAPDSGAPVKVGGRYLIPSVVLDEGDRADFITDIINQLRVKNNANGLAGGDGLANTLAATPTSAAGTDTRPLATAPFLSNGTTLDQARGDANGAVVQSGLSATFWNYAAAAGGISNTTTAVTIKAAAGASVRNYLKTLVVNAGALGAATELAVRDGAAGPVLARIPVLTGGISQTITFDPPLKGTANTLMEVVTLTATITGGVYANASGFTGA